jgi:hypothetical protein
MDTCTVETGLLKKKPCGKASVTHCLNCEQALCIDHALPELSAAGKKTGKFMCKECSVAAREHDKAVAAAAAKDPMKKPAPAAAPKPAAAAPKPGTPAPAPRKDEDSLGGIDFNPTKK